MIGAPVGGSRTGRGRGGSVERSGAGGRYVAVRDAATCTLEKSKCPLNNIDLRKHAIRPTIKNTKVEAKIEREVKNRGALTVNYCTAYAKKNVIIDRARY